MSRARQPGRHRAVKLTLVSDQPGVCSHAGCALRHCSHPPVWPPAGESDLLGFTMGQGAGRDDPNEYADRGNNDPNAR